MMRGLAKTLMTNAVNGWAYAAAFSFPSKYTWRWKIEMLAGRYEPETTRLFRRIVQPGMTVADVGAHIGYFSRLLARRVGPEGKVFAFEPDDENRALLSENVRGFPNVEVRSEAVTAEKGRVSFYHHAHSTGCHSTIAPAEAAASREVPAISLDSFMAERGIEWDFVKMDIEGGEANALRGMKRALENKRIRLVLEYNPRALARAGADPERFLSEIAARGFRIHALARGACTLLHEPFGISAEKLLGPGGSLNLYLSRV